MDPEPPRPIFSPSQWTPNGWPRIDRDASTATLPSWVHIWGVSIGVGVSIIGSLSLFMVLHHSGTSGGDIAPVAFFAQLIVAVLAVPLAIVAGAPLARLKKRLAAGELPEALPRKDVVDALRLPTRLFWAVWITHVVFAVVYVAAFYGHPIMHRTLRDVVPGAIAIGLISSSTQANVMAMLVRRRIARVLLPRGRLDHLVDADGNLPRTFVWQQLAIMVATLGIAWPVVLYTLFRVPGSAEGVAQYVLLGVLFFCLAAHQTFSIMRGVAGSVGHLAARMEEVRRGELDVQATIFGLDTFGVQTSDFNRMVEGLRQREQLKETFGRYVTRQVADEILSGRVALGGELKTATVLFSDIRGFTRMSEHLQPQEVVAFLNEYLAAMVDCVIEHGGVLDKFIGDAVMAVFGAPVSAGSAAADANAAVSCAVAMGKKLDEMNARRTSEGKEAIAIGIGVHTGELVAGNIGSPRRMQYTVIGDTVNVGSRLESLTKEHHRRTLISDATATLVKEHFPVIEVGTVPVRGRDEPLKIYGLQSEEAAAAA